MLGEDVEALKDGEMDAGDEDHGGMNNVLHAVVAQKEVKNTTLSLWTRGRFSGRITVATKDADAVVAIINGRSRLPVSTQERSPEQKIWR